MLRFLSKFLFAPGSIVGCCKITLLKQNNSKSSKTVRALLPVFRVKQTNQIPCGRNYAWWYSWSWLICRRKVIERAGVVGQKNVFENVDLWIWALTGLIFWQTKKKGVPADQNLCRDLQCIEWIIGVKLSKRENLIWKNGLKTHWGAVRNPPTTFVEKTHAGIFAMKNGCTKIEILIGVILVTWAGEADDSRVLP